MSEERFQHQIRLSASDLEQAERAVHRAEADLKKTIAMTKLQAAANGIKTAASQEIYADSTDAVYEARLTLGMAEAKRQAARVELKAREADFEQWKVEQYQLNREARRYGT